MKLRSSDMVMRQDEEKLFSRQLDDKMYHLGIVCILLMLSVTLTFMLL